MQHADMKYSQIPAIYTDKSGTIITTLVNNSEELAIDLDGTVFISRYLSDFTVGGKHTIPGRRFILNKYRKLTACKIFCKFPITIWKEGRQMAGFLATEINLLPEPDRSFFQCSFEREEDIISIGKVYHFETVFNELKRKLPDNISIRTCYTCQYSDYSVYGSGAFGTMLCFKSQKEAYSMVKDKDEYMDIMDQFDRLVQEIYVCEDFEQRGVKVGYRG
jgi:hypothetical protein